ncbi:MAG: DNA pilot protein [Microviridae sp.]|nr:MAG: DNA pilot protein [Microviridae sp.]
MAGPWTDFAVTQANNAISTGMGLALAGWNDHRQIKQQKKLNDMQIAGQMQLTDYNKQKQLELWNETNYPAQMEQLKKAGLNPGLMYGEGGGGGTTANVNTGSISGANAPQGGREVQDMIGMGIQLQLLQAQKANIEADTKNKEAATANLPKTGANIEASTASLLQGIENAKAQKELTEVQTEISRIDEDIKGATQNASKAMVMTTLRQATETLQMLTNEKIISDETRNTKIELVRTELATAYARNELTRAQTGKTQADTEQLAKQIALEYAKLSNEQDKTAILKKLQEFQTSFGNQAGQILHSLLGVR